MNKTSGNFLWLKTKTIDFSSRKKKLINELLGYLILNTILILNTVLNSGYHALFADTSFGAKFRNSKLRNLIGRKFLNFFYENFSLNTIETPWLSWI